LNGTVGKIIADVLLGVAEIEAEGLSTPTNCIKAAKVHDVYKGRKLGRTKAKEPRRQLARKAPAQKSCAGALEC